MGNNCQNEMIPVRLFASQQVHGFGAEAAGFSTSAAATGRFE
jgi:hypothetical protein